MEVARLTLVVLLVLSPGLARAQLLSRASSAVRGGSSQSDDDDSYDSDDDSYSDDSYSDDDWGDDNDSSLLGRASRSVRGSSASGSGGSGRGGSSRRRDPSVDLSFFASCPYDSSANTDGYLLDPVSPDGARRLARPAARVSLELGYAVEGAGRGGFAARLSVPFLIDFRVRYSTFLESADGGWIGAMLGRIGIEARLVESPNFILRIGAAGLHFHDADGAVPGLEGSLSADWFVAEPVVLSTEFGVGFVGEAISLSGRLTIGTMIDSTEIYLGYHYEGLLVAEQHVHLGGPIAGVRGWL